MICPALLQGLFPTQEWNPHLLYLLASTSGFFTTSATWEAPEGIRNLLFDFGPRADNTEQKTKEARLWGAGALHGTVSSLTSFSPKTRKCIYWGARVHSLLRKHYPQEGQDQEQSARHFSSTFSGSSLVIFTADSGVSSTTCFSRWGHHSSERERPRQRRTQSSHGKAPPVFSEACSLIWLLFDRHIWVCPPRSARLLSVYHLCGQREQSQEGIPRVRALLESHSFPPPHPGAAEERAM